MHSNIHSSYLQRCFQLAMLGSGYTSPNPTVGAILVHKERIIGEGYHQAYGAAHAEVNAVNSVHPSNRHLISQSTLYVSLEPCCIHGKTPPCTDLIIREKIKKVVIASLDQTPGVSGQGVQRLRAAGIEVMIMDELPDSQYASRIRNHFVTHQKPYIILKFAQSKDGFIGKKEQQVWLSNAYTKRLTHKWRSETDAIIVGTNTALTDNPRLTNRFFTGHSPLRIVLDKHLNLPPGLHLFDGESPTWVVTQSVPPFPAYPNTQFLSLPFDKNLLPEILNLLFEAKKSTLLVEGGAQLIHSFVEQNLWQEARIIYTDKFLHSGVKAPIFPKQKLQQLSISNDEVIFFSP